MSLLELFVITEHGAHTAMRFSYPKHELTLLSQLKSPRSTLQNVTSGDSEYIPRYYKESFRIIRGYTQKRRSQVQVTFGKYAGKSVELLMLKEPSYIKWVLDQQSPTGAMAKVKSYIQQLIKIFDAKPFGGKQCWVKSCNNAVTRFTVYLDKIDPYWWCDTCDPYQTGAISGKLQSPIGYTSALQHVELYCRGRKSDYVDIIKMISQAKGLPARVGEAQAQKFFHG